MGQWSTVIERRGQIDSLMRHAEFLIALSLFAIPTSTEAAAVTLWAKGYPITREGVLVGCSLEFNAATEDHFYRQGKMSSLVGSIALNKSDDPKKIPYFVGYKLIVRDLDGENVIPNAPASIHLVASDGTIWKGDPKQSFLSDTDGGRLQMLLPDDAMVRVFEGILSSKSVTLAFNRRPGGTDVRVPIDLTVANADLETKRVQRSDEAVDAWINCTSKLLAEYRKQD